MPVPSDVIPENQRPWSKATLLAERRAEAPSSDLVHGIPIGLTDYEGTLRWIDEAVRTRVLGYVCVSNVHAVMAAQEDPELREALMHSTINVPDGMPLVWALNLRGHNLRDRVYGPELMARACERAAESGQRFYLYGGRNQGALVQLALNLRTRYPGIRIVGGYSPPHRPLTAEEQTSVINEINDNDIDVVWVGIGVPKQEKWMAAMREHLTAPVLIGVGAAFDFHAGLVPQAPASLQNLGLEWAYRLMQEPRRLWRRYLRYNPQFMLHLARQTLMRRSGRGSAGRHR
jgi:N-acetylglucosaminyldiphosphoundecaprenol N-acetyl-beta-D-mannosaminyltransferase